MFNVPVWQCGLALPLAHSGESCRSYLHSAAILSVPQLWSKRNRKHYRTVEVTEGGESELLLFSHQMEPPVSLQVCHVTATRRDSECRHRHTAAGVGVGKASSFTTFAVLLTMSSIKVRCLSRSAPLEKELNQKLIFVASLD